MRAWILWILMWSTTGSIATFTEQPRLETVDGHLFIYGGSDKNLTFMTTSKGYVNVNGENLFRIVQDAKIASQLIKGMKYTALSEIQEGMKAVTANLELYAQRLNACEVFLSGKTKDTSYLPLVSLLNTRVKKLERKVRRISRNLMKNECRKDPCLNGGTCLDRYLGYECRCPEGWEGKKCEKDVNECAIFAGTDLGCQNGATCYNTRGSYECHCAPGWHGLHCLRRTNDCSSGSAAELCGHGICVTQVNSPRGYTCICSQGWKTDENHACTVDVDECATAPCSRNPPVQCHNAPGSFFCGPCPPGYTGNGFQCSDVDECLVENGGCSTEPMVACINTMGSSTCESCPPGYSGDGRTCVFVGKCNVDNGGCHPNARCIEVGLHVQCQCPPGYSGFGVGIFGCKVISGPVSANPCEPNPCMNNGRCYSTSANNFTCSCMPGFSGRTCSVIHSCDNNPCQNGGTCEMKNNVLKCKCPPRYRGTFCEEREEGCGEYLKGDEGMLKFPEGGAGMQYEFNCAWVIRVNLTKVINITFSEFQLKSSFECTLEWLEIHDGRSTGDATIGKFCSKSLPNNGTIITTQNNVYIWFKTIGYFNSKFHLSWKAVDPVCGGAINASVHGVITSPGYPVKYPNNRDCYWEVSAPIGKRIMFTVFELRLNSGSSCMNDFVEIHEGMSLESALLAKFCNTSAPEIIETPGNTAYIYFHTDNKGTEKGFQMAYHPKPGHPGCGGVYTTFRGEITPPTRNDMYLPNMDCAWVIRLPEDRRIKLEFITFSVQSSRSCRDDFLEVRDGGDITAPLLGKYCGTDLPPPISSNHKTIFVRFFTDEIVERSGFKIRYKSLCDETFTAPSGVIKSPGYPNTYKSEEECVMIIEQPAGKIINLEFQEFEIESTYRCIFDYVEIRDGHDESSPLIGRYCGSNRPGRVVSTHNYLYIKMVTDNNVELGGFYGNYSTVDVSCGGIFTAPTGVINSPTEGDHYPSKAYCRWVIAVKPGQLIQLSFPKFKVEGFNGCYFDYVAVYDNSTELKGNNLIGRYCNNNLPPLLTSASNVLTIIFSSDPSFTDEGFSATYIAVNGSSTCGGKFFTEWGVIKSPNYPDLYPNGITCNWVIHVKNGHKIHLNITDFFLERPFLLGGKKCKFDYLEIRDGGYSSSPLIGRYCGTKIPNEIVSQSNNLYIEFSSDNLDSGRGFQIFWDGSVRGCGGTLTGPKGSIISPNYPERYGSIVNCLYHISVSHGSRIRLNFVDLELETSASCYKEYLEVLDGSDLQGKSLGRFCTLFNVPPGITSSGNHLTIKFKSGLSSTGKGFYINYFTLCRTNTTGYRGVIESPNYPNDYPTSLDCMWSIKAPLGNKIAIQFTDFVMRGSCRNAYLEVSDSDPETPPLTDVKKYCRNNKTLTMESSDQFMNLRFVTSERLIGGHFRLEWAVKGCGGYLTKPSGTFTSPNYPNLYPTNINCEWWITVDPMKSISLVFSDISFERNEDCSFDGVEVYGGSDKTAPLLTRICTTRKDDVVITSSGNQLYIFFHSDPSNVARGFKASYYTTASSCGGLFTASSGTIHSRNYPMNYQADNCEWRIYVDVNHRVNLTFIKFDVNDEGNCTYASVEVFDGSSTAYPSVWRHCGNKIPEPNSVISTGDSLTVRMKVANASFTAMGFFASYSMICGGIVDADVSGVIEGGSELNLAPGAKCTWLITTSEPDGHVMLTLSNVELSQYDEYDSTCYSEHLLVYDGPDENSTLIGTYCKTTSPLPIVSHGNQLLLKFVASYNVNSFFQVMYSSASSACGGDLYSQRGQFASPNYPDSYPPNSECIWTLNSAPGNKIQLNFKVFDVGASENCNDEYVEIRDKDATGKLVGVYCGSDNPGSLTAHNTIWVKFKSKAGGSGSMKFLADYSIVYGNEINGTSGQIASPNYPRMFSSYTPVSWRITVGFKNYILFEFKDLYLASIAVEDCTRSLTIYDGFDDTAPLLIKKCDAEIPSSPLTSSSNVAYIVLQSEPFHLGGRFLLDWSETKSMIQVPIAPTSSPIPGCGGEYFLSSKDNSSVEITVPGSSNPNQNKIKCSWKISCPEEEHLSVSVKSFDAKHFVYCDFTNLEVSTNFEGSWKEVVKFCGNKAVNGTYHGHSVILITASFEWAPTTSPASLIVSTECGGSIRKTNGIIDFSWKNYSKSHHVSQAQFRLGQYSCQWDIVVTPGRTIRTNLLHFSDMVTQDGICQDNYFSLRNGGSEDSPYLGGGVYCSVTGIVPRTTSNKLFIKVLPAYTFYAFTLMFEEVPHECGGKVTLDSKMNSTTISSPNYPSVPPIKVECIWTFVTVGVRRLRMDFLDRFDLAYSNDCKMEYVSVHDGGTELSDEMGRYCQEKPSTLRTTGNMLYVKYYTNTTDPQNGFRARISIDDCGGIITGSSGVLTSPGYPYSYPYNVDCHWEIETTSMSTLKIKVVDVDLPHNLSVISAEEYSLATLELLLSYMRGDALHVNGTNCTSAARLTISEPFSGEVRPRGSRLTSKESNVPGDQNQSLLPLAVVCSNGETPSVQTSRNKAVITFKSAAWDVGHYFVSPRGFKLNFTSARSSCVQRMYSESGVIESPKKLVNRIGFYNCEWVITVPRGRRVSVTFADSIIPFFSTGVVLVAYNDHSYRSQIGSLIPSAGGNKVVKSTSNLMLISYVSPYVPRYSSFRLLYNSDEPAVCGGNISDSSGSIESPKNLSSFYCPWFFFQQPGGNKTLSITVYDAVIGNKTGLCTPRFGSFLYLKAKGESLDHQAVLCGNVTSETIRTPFTRATLTGLKNLKYSGEVNFKVKYKVLPCGGVLTGSKFVVTNPNYPDDYPSGMECSWLVTVPFDGIVKITFEELKLGNKPDCKDYLTVKNGPRLDSPTIGTLCGSPTDSKPIISETPSVLIEFHSDESSSENSSVRRFKLKIEEMDSACGGIVHSEDTEISSPHFPKPYANNEECEWEIRTREGMHVGLVFQDRFHIEDSTDCKKDYLKVYDYVEEEWKLLKTLCGREFPPPINSTTNRMKIVFHSDSTVSSDGFKAKWTSNCGATFSNVKSGRIVSPGYPGRYPGDIRCEYIITYPAMEIDFNFTSFDLEKGLQGLCSYDSVEFFRYTWQNEYRSEGKFCGSVLPKPISIYRHAKIVFTTDTYVNKTGFELLFSVDVCGGVISKPTELNFTFGRGFSLRNDCVWNITAPENKIVVLRFTRIMLPISTNCEDTSLQVIEYNSTGSPVVLAKMCGLVYNNLPVIHSTKSNVTLLTDKLYHEPQKGFRVLISFSYGKEQGCGGSVSLNSNPATITSPDVNRDGKYEDLMDCSWLILAKPFHYITANFLELDIDNCGTTVSSNLNCSCDFVELRNGIDPNSDVIQTGCGDAPPPPVVSSGSAMSLRFVTDATNSRRGFTVRFSTLLSECGFGFLNVTDKPQTLTSPKYPDKYPLGVRCRWTITDRTNTLHIEKKVIHIHVIEWDMEDGDMLTFRKTGGTLGRIIDGDESRKQNQPSYVIGKSVYYSYTNAFLENDRTITGKGNSLDYYALSDEVTIDFVSKGKSPKKGFKLEYSIAGCTRNYSSDHGQIVVNFRRNLMCDIVIEAPTSNHTISLYITNIQMYYGDYTCPTSSVQVFDGRSDGAALLKKFCGTEIPNPIYSSGQYLTIKLNIDSKKELYPMTKQDVLDMTFTTTTKGPGCGGRVSAMRGVIYSAGYPNNVRKNTKCRWDITVPSGLEAVIKFVAFDIGPANTCETDYVTISDVDLDGSENLRSTFCGGQEPAEIRSQADGVAVVYHTSVHNGGTGWKIEYSLVVPGSEIDSPGLDKSEALEHDPVLTSGCN